MVRDPARRLTRNQSESVLFISVFVLVGAFAGCAPHAGSQLADSSASASTIADRDDIDAAVEATLTRHRLAVEARETDPTGAMQFFLRTHLDEPGLLTLTPSPDGSLTVTCAIGRFGRPALEREVVQSVTTRLGQLKGDHVAAPIDW